MTEATATILVVEDDAPLLEGLGEALETRGYVAIRAAGARHALKALEAVTPDVIVSDIVMPDMDGYALLDAVRSEPRLATVPFIFLTARDERAAYRTGMEHGADDYVTKPFRTDELLEAISSRLQRRRAIEAVQAVERDDWVSALAATLHHELRTPLAELGANVELLDASKPGFDQADLDLIFRGLHAGIERLSTLVADFLLLSDLRTGRALEDHEERLDRITTWDGLLAEVLRRWEPAARTRGVRLRLVVEPELPTVRGDRTRLVDAIGRLVDNAIKFSPADGEVLVEAQPLEGALSISVHDSGPGLDPTAIEAIYWPLQQLGRWRFEQQGVGNGLAICRGIVDLHDGTLTASSRSGGGSTFTVRLPAAAT